MSDKLEYADIPQGFSRALMQNMYAQQYFTSLSDDARQAIVHRAANIVSEEEMRHFVNGLVNH